MSTVRRAGRRRLRGPRGGGFTLVELLIASAVGLAVLLALSHLLLANQRHFAAERSRVLLQQELTRCLEEMTRSIHAAHTLQVDHAGQFRTLAADDSALRVFGRDGLGDRARLRVGTSGLEADLADLRCEDFQVTANAEGTTLDLYLSLADEAGNTVSARTQATLRNRTLPF